MGFGVQHPADRHSSGRSGYAALALNIPAQLGVQSLAYAFGCDTFYAQVGVHKVATPMHQASLESNNSYD